MTTLSDVAVSVLDLAMISEGQTASDAFDKSVAFARHVEALGYRRFWLAEHHNIGGIASSATAVLIGHVAGATSTIRVGSGGIMLPNHAPLIVAEQFGTLAALYPGRIDLGLGRAPGTDAVTARALRRDLQGQDEDFQTLLAELRGYFAQTSGRAHVRAIPGEGLDVPIYLLGSSGYSAQLAGYLGLPFAFASHFAPGYLLPALELYRNSFRPSTVLDKPYVIVGANVIVADNDDLARRLATSQRLKFLQLLRGTMGPLQPPVDSMDGLWNASEDAGVERFLRVSAVGGPTKVQAELQALVDQTQADELIVVMDIYDFDAKLHSLDMLAAMCRVHQPA
jgi:luciferase family oxidoreductase group 1